MFFWIGEDLKEGKIEADRAANLDIDDYHDWIIFEFVKPKDDNFEYQQEHEKVYKGIRKKTNLAC